MTALEDYYNKFNEEKRLNSRHGRVEFEISMKYLRDYLKKGDRIVDVGAGTGRYSIPLWQMGYDVTAIELVQHNLGMLKQKVRKFSEENFENNKITGVINAYKGNALKLKRCESESFDVTILFGPMYHLASFDDKLKALEEAKRVTKRGGYIFVAYVMNEYAVLTHAFKEKNILADIAAGKLDEAFHTQFGEDDLYSFVRIEDIDKLNEVAGLKRVKIFSPDGPANHMRQYLNALTQEEYEMFINYQLSVCERYDLLGASAHTVDILQKDM